MFVSYQGQQQSWQFTLRVSWLLVAAELMQQHRVGAEVTVLDAKVTVIVVGVVSYPSVTRAKAAVGRVKTLTDRTAITSMLPDNAVTGERRFNG